MFASFSFINSLGLNTDIVGLLRQTGWVGWCVLLTLLVLSVLSWAVIGFKLVQVRRIKKTDQLYLGVFRSSPSLKDAHLAVSRHQQSTLANIFRTGYSELSRQRPKESPDASGHTRSATAHISMRSLERAMRRTQRIESDKLRKYLAILATTASVSPFIGLFGTVWGIMNAFHSIGMQASASLAVVAPGIAEALVATAAGLGAAIPAVVGYNYFHARIRDISTEMESFILEFLNLIEAFAIKEGTLAD